MNGVNFQLGSELLPRWQRPILCVDCGGPFIRASNIGQPPKRCLECRGRQKPNRGASKGRKCADCGVDVLGGAQVRCGDCKRRFDSALKRRYALENPERSAAAVKKYRESPEAKAVAREGSLARKYGVTLARYAEMLQAQGGVCAICGGADPQAARGAGVFAVDHDHATGRVRGLLCFPCNTLLGVARDDVGVLRKASRYLRSLK